jgi:hypothetical protein
LLRNGDTLVVRWVDRLGKELSGQRAARAQQSEREYDASQVSD